MQPRDVLDIEETARLLRVSRRAVERLVSKGAIPCGRVGRRVRFVRAAVIAWLEAGGSGARAPQPVRPVRAPARRPDSQADVLEVLSAVGPRRT